MKEHVSGPLATLQRYLHTDLHYLLKGGGWLTFGQAVGMLLSFGSAVAYANLLTQADYGTYKYILSLMALCAIPALSGMGVAVTQSVGRGEVGSFLPAFRAKLAWGLLGSIASLLAGFYYLMIAHNQILGTALILVAPFAPLLDSFTLWNSYLAGKQKFRESVLYGIIVQLISTVLTIGILFVTKNVLVLVTVYTLSYTILRGYTHYHIMKRHPELSLTPHTSSQNTIRFGKHLSFINIFTTVVGQLDTLLLWHFLGAAPLAIYAFAQATTTPAKTLFKMLVTLALPRFSSQNTETLKTTLPKKVIRSSFLFFPVVLIYILIIPYVYRVFFPAYLESALYAQVLGLMFFLFPAKVFGTAVSTRENKDAIYRLNIVNTMLNTVLLLVLIPYFGIWGAIWTTLIQHFGSMLITYSFFRKM